MISDPSEPRGPEQDGARYEDVVDLAHVFDNTEKKERLRLGGALVAAGKYKFNIDIMHRFVERNGKGGRVIAGHRRYAGHFTARRKGRRHRVAYIKVSKEQVPVMHDHGRENGHRGEEREHENDKEYECYRPHTKSIVQFSVLSMAV